jgi:probable HAF family extracellular repeat protein
VNGVDHGFLYSSGTYTVLNFPVAIDPEAISTYALSINNAGQVVGGYLDNNGHGGQTLGFLYSHGTYRTIEPPNAIQSAATSINKFGTIVGWYETSSGGPELGFEYSHGTYTLLDFPGAVTTVPTSINDKGQITGYYQTSSATDPQHGFVYSNGQYTSIDPPAGVDPFTISINNSGQIVGYYSDNTTNHGFLATDPPTPPVTGADRAGNDSRWLTNVQDLTVVTLQLVHAMASFSPTGSALAASPFNQKTFDVMQLSNHLAQPH